MKRTYSLAQLPEITALLRESLESRSMIALTGQLGAGKTTLVQNLLRSWGVQEAITSPTFTYVNCYKLATGLIIYHFDLYRLTTLASFLELGFDEYLSQPNSLVIIEWPEIIAPILEQLRDKVLRINLECLGDGERKITLGEDSDD
ncbi:MAG TPA: tRNA (adenosine(37)-N6)-threonylcarbamoyltransferase complex ATPase subunit type 1 TsaE [Candidatus Babeliales bacterium]|nr:tRNA (adenosine(37)-N6)-threonylcarbamoyltransferase complex ATPase subunit type 1 TsaE [Candidatus Babeliales bacterium]